MDWFIYHRDLRHECVLQLETVSRGSAKKILKKFAELFGKHLCQIIFFK